MNKWATATETWKLFLKSQMELLEMKNMMISEMKSFNVQTEHSRGKNQ